MICSVDGCTALTKQRRRMCGAHYQRKLKYGDPLAGGTPKGALERFLRDRASYTGDDCLKWPFGDKGNGYGSLDFEGRKTTASNAMCTLAHGRRPSAKHEAAHSCGNGHLGCVNPRHLRWATRRENVHDAIRHGTQSRGPKHSAAIKRGLGVPVETLTKEARE